MNQVHTTLAHAEKHCKAHGSRLTDKRKHVLSGLLQERKAMSAYELVEYCRSEYDEKIPAMSVYRILEFLQEEHLVHKLNLANKFVACAHIDGEHTHSITQFLICEQCQKVEEVSISALAISELENNVDEAGFQIVKRQLEISCICQSCLNKVI